jgi:hypothetical protein
MGLSELLAQNARPIVDGATERVSTARLRHYDGAGTDVMRSRYELLFELVAQTVDTRNIAPVLEWADETARDRFGHGYGLYEVQTAVNVLEETIWQELEQLLEPAEFVEAIGVVSTVLGQAKDAVARAYVELASKGGVKRNLADMWSAVPLKGKP